MGFKMKPQKFVKKPIVIEAIQWNGTGECATAIADWILSTGHRVATFMDGETSFHIETLEGTMKASLGDWVLRGVQGEHYPCKPDIFEATYEAVNEE